MPARQKSRTKTPPLIADAFMNACEPYCDGKGARVLQRAFVHLVNAVRFDARQVEHVLLHAEDEEDGTESEAELNDIRLYLARIVADDISAWTICPAKRCMRARRCKADFRCFEWRREPTERELAAAMAFMRDAMLARHGQGK
jgi:hypothetical protein